MDERTPDDIEREVRERDPLAKDGLVKDTGQRRPVRSGRSAIVWGLPV